MNGYDEHNIRFELRHPLCVFKLQYKVDNVVKTQLLYLLANVGKIASNCMFRPL